jgi:putative permease
MISAFKAWYQRYLGKQEAGYLIYVLLFFIILTSCFTHMLAPVFFSVVIAYLLDSCVTVLEKCHVPHWLAVLLIFIIFLTLGLLTMFAVFPLLINQLSNLLNDAPKLTERLHDVLLYVRSQAPFISDEELRQFFLSVKQQLMYRGQHLVSISLASIPNLITFVVYFVMTPLLIYFFLMDRSEILQWCSRFLPKERTALKEVWNELHKQIGNYIRGKFLEAIIFGLATYVVFKVLGLDYSALLAVTVALSVFVPYIGAVLVTIPVVIIAALQWGMGENFLYLIIAYAILLTLDGTVLVALLFSGTNNLHPVVIIIATLVFGGIWGFWGVFFAIPLASLVKALIEFWPVDKKVELHQEQK